MAIDATVGGASSNSYITDAEALSLVAQMFPSGDSAWAAATAATREPYILEASYLLGMGQWKSRKNDTAQALRFPSTYMVNDAGTLVIPTEVKRATAVLSFELYRDEDMISEPADVESVSIVGSASVKKGSGGAANRGDGALWDNFPERVRAEMRRHEWRSGSSSGRRYDPITRTTT